MAQNDRANGSYESEYTRALRNCLAHYGLGQYISEKELDSDDIIKGLTNKAFNMDYVAEKECLYTYLSELVQQIKLEILD